MYTLQRQNIMHPYALLFLIPVLVVCMCVAFDADEDVIFKLYKRENLNNFTVLKINGSRALSNDSFEAFDANLLTRIHIHGFLPKEEIIDRYRDVYLSIGDYNFIVVDWSEGATTINYYFAKRRVKDVSFVSKFLK